MLPELVSALSPEDVQLLSQLDMSLLPDEEHLLAEEARRDFRAFIPYAWPVIEPGKQYVASREVEAMAVHLEAITQGLIQDLVINIRPRASKSRICSVLWPVWDWLQNPTLEYFTASFDLGLAREHAVLARDLVESSWFRARWGRQLAVSKQRRADSWFRTTAGGSRRIASPRAGTTGRGGDRLLFDDPHDVEKVDSKKDLEKTIRWMRRAFFTRRNNDKKSARVVIGQRTRGNDAFAYIRDNEPSFEWVVLPTAYEAARRRPPTSIGWEDPRTEEGELLAHPSRFDAAADARARVTLGDDYNAQHKQEPTPGEGTTFRLEDFRRWRFTGEEMRRGVLLEANDALGRRVALVPEPGPEGSLWADFFDDLCWSWDCTFTGEADSDMVVGALWGRKGPDFYLLYQARGRMDFTATQSLMVQLAALYPRVFTKLVEKAANADALVNVLQRKLLGLVLVPTKGKSKKARARAVAPLVRAGNVYVPEDYVSWGPDSSVALFLEEVRSFPKGANDDQVDAMSQALMHLYGSYWKWLEAMAQATGAAPPLSMLSGMGEQ